MQLTRVLSPFVFITFSVVVTGCGGGGGGGGGSNPPPVAQTDFEQGIFSNPSLYKDICLNPRTGNFPDTQGAEEDENDWLRAWSHDLYLWYDEIVDEDPRDYATPDYFDLMQTFATTPSGAPKDQFHFTFDTQAWQQLSQSGVSAGYGAEFELVSATAPRRIVVAYIEPGSPAESAGVTRGTVVTEVDGEDAINGTDTDTLNAGLFPATAGELHNFVIEDFDGANSRSISMTSADVTQEPVPTSTVLNTGSGPVGYLVFHSHIATAEEGLVNAMSAFESAGVVELIVDLRYNGGGFLDIANEFAFMIAGPSAASGRTFDETQFNHKHPTINPVTGAALMPDAFHTTTQGFSLPAGNPLPSVNVPRVFVLSGPGTCSASEAIINGLRGIGVEVILIGDTTCGKPYGFYPTDNCGTTYFTIQFRGVNAQGFGDYADGFVPTETPVEAYEVMGCAAPDDFGRQLGDINEVRLATALDYIGTGVCNVPPVAFAASAGAKAVQLDDADSAGTNAASRLTKPVRMPGTVKR